MRKWKQVLVALATTAGLASGARADRIAYESGGDIWVMNADGTMNRRATQSTLTKAEPDLSPDGRRLVFTGVLYHPAPTGGSYSNNGIYSANIDGSGSRCLTPNGVMNLGYPAWSPDGREILFQGLLAGQRNQGVCLMDSNGSNLRRLGESDGRSPAWSADGQRIAYIAFEDSGGQSIQVIDRAGHLLHRIPWPMLSADLAWSPDGRWFYLDGGVALDGGFRATYEIYRVSYDGQTIERLTNDLANDFAPSVSPDGKSFVCHSSSDPLKPLDLRLDLRVVNVDGGIRRAFSPAISGWHPSWSPAPALPTLRPTVRVASPASGSITNRLAAISGVVSDGNGLSDIRSLAVTLRRPDGLYWNGLSWQALPFGLTLTRAESAWRVSSPLPAGGALSEGLSVVEATATDKDGLTSRSSTAVRIDLTPPQISSVALSFNSTRSSLIGTWRDAGSIASIFVQVRRGDGTFWNGRAWQAASFLLPATLSDTNATKTSGRFSLSAGLPLQRDLTAGSLLSILVIDRAGNRGGTQQKVGPPPSVPRA